MSEKLANAHQIMLLWCPKCQMFWWNEGETHCPNNCGSQVIPKTMVEKESILMMNLNKLQKIIELCNQNDGWNPNNQRIAEIRNIAEDLLKEARIPQ